MATREEPKTSNPQPAPKPVIVITSGAQRVSEVAARFNAALAEFGYPPDRHLIRHVFRGRNAEKVNFVADAWVKELERLHPGLCEIRGPAPCPFEKVQDQHRVHIWYLVTGVKSLLAALLPLRGKIPSRLASAKPHQ